MSDSRLQGIRSALENADNFINQQEPDQALELLNGIQDDIPFYPDTPESVKFSLCRGEALSAKDDPLAEDWLREAEEKTTRVPGLSPELRLRPPEHLGDFYARSHRTLGLARSAFERAKAIAVEQHCKYDIDRIQLKLIRVDLQKKRDDVELSNFRTLRKIGKDKVFTWSEQLMAWNIHKGLPRDIRFARIPKERDDAYFLNLLRSVRKDHEGSDPEQQLDLFQ